MTRFSGGVWLVLFVWTLPIFGALACQPSAQPPTMEQILKAEETFKNSTSSLARVASYKVMLGTSDPDVRQAVLEMGLESEDDAIRSTALRCMFLGSRTLLFESLDFEEAIAADPNMSEAERKLVEEGWKVTFPVYYSDTANSCLSIRSRSTNECSASQQSVVSGLSISVVSGRDFRANFELRGQVLLGEMSKFDGRNGYHSVPARLRLN